MTEAPMGPAFREVETRTETRVEPPIETRQDQQDRRCRDEPRNGWIPGLNKIFGYLVWVAETRADRHR
jgi:hypothetical protein